MDQIQAYKKLSGVITVVAAFVLLAACAQIGNPTGGPRDEDPPRFVGANPPIGSTRVDRKRIVLNFDELVNVKEAISKVVVSPTSAKAPRVSSQGHRVIVDFADTLQPNTTYTIDFSNSIEDNNEGNKLPSFAYWFSTGQEIDSLRIAGIVLAARNLEPQQSMLVGVYSNPVDSTFKTTRLERIAKTDDCGRFVIRGLKPGKYRLFALADANNDYRWDNPDEDIAFTDFEIEPTTSRVSTTDTLYNMKTGAVDSLVTRMRTKYLPNDVLLSSFNIGYKQQYLVKNERIDSTRLSLIFNAPQSELPELRLSGRNDDWYTLERTAHNDTLTYWITDPEVIATDTLHISLTYLATDSTKSLSPRTDSLRLLTQRPRANAKKNDKKSADKAPEVKHLDMNVSGLGTHDIDAPLYFEFGTPLARLDEDAFKIEVKKDSIWEDGGVKVRLQPTDSTSVRRFKIDYPWKYGESYRLTVDSLAATGIYGLSTDDISKEITVKKQSDYFDLTFRITGVADSVPAFVELLNSSDNPVNKAIVENGVARFVNIPLGTYYARLVEDVNGNGEYDTGDFDTKRQPEFVYYYPKALKITKRWDLDQQWNVLATPIDMQKPSAIKKNKSEAEKKRRTKSTTDDDEEDETFDPMRNPFDPNTRTRRQRM